MKRWKIKRKMETLEKNQIEVLELKDTILEMKNPLNGFNSRLDTAQERISDYEDRSIVIIQTEAQK